MRFGIKAGYVERAVPEYVDDDNTGGFQPHVYDLAACLGRLAQSRRALAGNQTIIDIGCGKAVKLAGLNRSGFSPEFDIIGIDTGANLAVARQSPFGTWFDVDLERVGPSILSSYDVDGAVLICADVIEHLVDPTCLVKTLREWMRLAAVGLLSTPERVLCYGPEHNGPPPNPSHVREWTRVELVTYLTASGLDVAFSGITQTHAAHPETGAHQGCQTTLVVLAPVP